MASSFKPPWYLQSGHVQTILTAVYRPKQLLSTTIEHIVPLPGNIGSTAIYENRPVDSCEDGSEGASCQAVLLLHGLGSSHRGTYMTNVAARLVAKGHRVIRVDLPGCGPSSRLTWLPGHGGCSEEIWEILAWCHARLGIQEWQAIGFSLGGNILLRMLATHGEDLQGKKVPWTFRKALAIAPPIDLAACSDGMEKGVNRLYARYFLKVLKAEAIRRAQAWPQWSGLALHPFPKTIRRFDDRFTAPLAGFIDAEDYYVQSSSGPLLRRIVTPTTILCDRHDPIIPAHLFDEATGHSSIQLEWTERGGHLGYLHRDPDGRYSRWADAWAASFITESNREWRPAPS